jgi:hypothetical protein
MASSTEPTTGEIISTSMVSTMRNSTVNSTMVSNTTQSAATTLTSTLVTVTLAITNSTESLLVSSTDSMNLTTSKTFVNSIQPFQTTIISLTSKIESASPTTSIREATVPVSAPQAASDNFEEGTYSNDSIAGIVAGGGALIAAGATLLCFKRKNSDSRNLGLANARSSINSMNILFEIPRGNDENSLYQELGSMEV